MNVASLYSIVVQAFNPCLVAAARRRLEGHEGVNKLLDEDEENISDTEDYHEARDVTPQEASRQLKIQLDQMRTTFRMTDTPSIEETAGDATASNQEPSSLGVEHQRQTESRDRRSSTQPTSTTGSYRPPQMTEPRLATKNSASFPVEQSETIQSGQQINKHSRPTGPLSTGHTFLNTEASSAVNPIQEVQQWLASIHMLEYWPLFEESGYDDLFVVAELEEEKLKADVKITKPGHIRKLAAETRKLKQRFIEAQSQNASSSRELPAFIA